MRRIAPSKRLWCFYPTHETEFRVRELAALNTLDVSEVVTRLIYLALKDGTEFTPLPAGTKLVLSKPQGRQAKYTLPRELADYMDGLVALGFSVAYVGERLIKRGLDIVRSRKNPGEGALVGQWDTEQAPDNPSGPDLDTLKDRAMAAILPPEKRSPEPVREAGPGVLRQVADTGGNDDKPPAGGEGDVPGDGVRDAVDGGIAVGSALVGPPDVKRILRGNWKSVRELKTWNRDRPAAARPALRHEGCGGLIGDDTSLPPYFDDDGLHYPSRCECGAILSGPLARKEGNDAKSG